MVFRNLLRRKRITFRSKFLGLFRPQRKRGNGVSLNQRLSTNFSYEEMVRSQTATRYGIENTPDSAQRTALVSLCVNTLEPIRILSGHKPVAISSGFRSPELNTKIGGSANSQHRDGEAADFTVQGYTAHEMWKEIVLSNVPFDQCILEFGAWIHISYVNPLCGENRRKISIATKAYVEGVRTPVTEYTHYRESDIIEGTYSWENPS